MFQIRLPEGWQQVAADVPTCDAHGVSDCGGIVCNLTSLACMGDECTGKHLCTESRERAERFHSSNQFGR